MATERARAVLAYTTAVERSIVALREPLPAAPFLAWAQRREQQIRREIDHYPAISGSRDGGVEARGPMNIDPRGRLVLEFGWDADSGTRMLFRWRHENQSGLVERATVEDALFTAGVLFADIYPDVPPPRPLFSRIGMGRKMTDAQIIAAHTVYTRARLTVRQVAELVHERYGHASPEAADAALRNAWRGLGLPLRECPSTTQWGTPCGKRPMSGEDHCQSHIAPGWPMPDELVMRARVMHERGMYFLEIGAALLHETPFRSPKFLSERLARIAARDGWHRTSQFGRKRRRLVNARPVDAGLRRAA